jgi:transglutaminase-like putative cysteine protease
MKTGTGAARRRLSGTIATWIVVTLAAATSALAETNKNPYNPGWKYHTHKEHIEVHKDGSSVRKYEYAYTALAESALESLNEQTISYHEGEETLEDVVAYTLKKDGTRVDVPDSNVQVTSHNGVNGAAPAFSDYKDRRIVFSDVEVGDSVVLAYTIREHKPTFKNHFSLLTYYSDADIYDDAELVVTAPKSLGLRQKTYNLGAPSISMPDKDLQQWKWTYTNQQARDRRAETHAYQRVWRYADWPTIEVSNFKDYGKIAAAYDEEAAKRAVVTERIRKLSGEIIGGAASKREQAEKIYAWVAKNISFAGNCLSGGDVVPRETDAVLNMKMGDCKDHATLMQALLSAQGIKSTQALVNTGSWYEVPEIPCWQAFNHVINYLPEFDLYLDATSTSSPFGALPEQERGKPAIRTSLYHGVERIPMRGADANWSRSVDTVSVSADGTVEVRSRYEVGGALANALSQRFGEWKKSPDFDGGTLLFRRWIEQLGYKGSGGYDHIADADGPLETFAYEMHYRIEDYLDTTNPYGVTLATLFPNPNSIAAAGALAAIDQYDHDFLCHGDSKTEELSIAFPDNVKLLAVPRNVHEQTALVRFDVNYDQQGNAIHIKRALIDTTPGPVCAPAIVSQYTKIAAAVKKDAKAQAVYQPK